MKLLTAILITTAAVVTAQECQESSLLSCFSSAVAPIKTACPADDTACICGKLRVEEPCFTSWCPGGAFPGGFDRIYRSTCKGGSLSTAAASVVSAAVTTGETAMVTTRGTAVGTTSNALTAAPATKTSSGAQATGAGERLAIPAIARVLAVVGGGVVLL